MGSCKKFNAKRIHFESQGVDLCASTFISTLLKLIGSMFTRPLHCPGFDNAFVSFGSSGEKNTYLLPWGWPVELKTWLYAG